MKMKVLKQHYLAATDLLDRIANEALPLCARLIFAATLTVFFWRAVLTKFGDGLTGLVIPSAGAYGQILPQRFASVGYDTDALNSLDWLIVMLGTYGELFLPIMIVIGLATRFAAIGMIGFLLVMSMVDIWGHNVMPGQLFDGDPGGIIADQRLYWLLLLLILVFRGAGAISVDHLLGCWLAGRPENRQSSDMLFR